MVGKIARNANWRRFQDVLSCELSHTCANFCVVSQNIGAVLNTRELGTSRHHRQIRFWTANLFSHFICKIAIQRQSVPYTVNRKRETSFNRITYYRVRSQRHPSIETESDFVGCMCVRQHKWRTKKTCKYSEQNIYICLGFVCSIPVKVE